MLATSRGTKKKLKNVIKIRNLEKEKEVKNVNVKMKYFHLPSSFCFNLNPGRKRGKGDKKGSSLCCFKVLNKRAEEKTFGGWVGGGKRWKIFEALKIFADVFNGK